MDNLSDDKDTVGFLYNQKFITLFARAHCWFPNSARWILIHNLISYIARTDFNILHPHLTVCFFQVFLLKFYKPFFYLNDATYPTLLTHNAHEVPNSWNRPTKSPIFLKQFYRILIMSLSSPLLQPSQTSTFSRKKIKFQQPRHYGRSVKLTTHIHRVLALTDVNIGTSLYTYHLLLESLS
jgi:hypothetical protein